MNDIREKLKERLRAALSLALSAAMLMSGVPALGDGAQAMPIATLSPEQEAQLGALDATQELVAAQLSSAAAPTELPSVEPGSAGAEAAAAPTSLPTQVPTASPEATAAAPKSISVELVLGNGYDYQLIKPGVDATVNVKSRLEALPEGATVELSGAGLDVSPASQSVGASGTCAFSVHADSDGVYSATVLARAQDGTVLDKGELLFICAQDAGDFAIPIICSDLVGKSINKVDYVRTDDTSTRLEVNSALMPAGYSASWSISTTSGEGNATIQLTRNGGTQTPPILYTKSNVANVHATVTLTVTLPAGERLTRSIPVNYEVRAQVPTGFKSTGDVLIAQLGSVSAVDLTTSESGSALTSGMSVAAELMSQTDAQLTTTTFSPEDGLSIGATRAGVYRVRITATSDVPGVVDGAQFSKEVHLIVTDEHGQLPDGLFALSPSALEVSVYGDSSELGNVSVAHMSPVASSAEYSATWQVTGPGGAQANISADASASSNGTSAVLRASGALTSGEYTVTATVSYKGATKTLTMPLTISANAPRIDGLRDSYTVPAQYSSYVISALSVLTETAEGVWREYSGDVRWSCEPADAASAAAFSSVTTDPSTGYTVFALPGTRTPGMYYFRFTAALEDGRTASQTVMLGIEDASGSVPTPSPTPDPNQPRKGTVNANRVNVRSGPGTDSRVLGQVVRGQQLTFNEWTGEWYSFTYNGTTAYIKGEYILLEGETRPTATPTPTATVAPATTPTATTTPASVRKGTVNANRVNVRSGPGTNSSVLGQVLRDAELAIEDWSGEWYRFTYNGAVAYIKGEYVTLEEQATAAPTAAPTYTPAPSPTTAPTSEPVYGTVTLDSGSLRLREQPNATARVLTNMPNRARVQILGRTGSWYRVLYGSYEGYASCDYIVQGTSAPEATATPTARPTTAPTATAAPTATPSVRKGTVSLGSPSSRLIVRSGPGTSYGELTRLGNGTSVTILGSESGFYRIQLSDGRTGYVSNKYVTLDGAAAPTATPRPSATARPTASPTPTANVQYATVIKADGLPLHETEQGATVRVIPNYGVVQVLKRYGSWTHVSYEGTVGYVESKYLKSGIVKPDGDSTELRAQVTLASSSAMHLRASASQSSSSLAMIPNGATVSVLSRGDTWSRVSYNGKTGYCMTRYLTILG